MILVSAATHSVALWLEKGGMNSKGEEKESRRTLMNMGNVTRDEERG